MPKQETSVYGNVPSGKTYYYQDDHNYACHVIYNADVNKKRTHD